MTTTNFSKFLIAAFAASSLFLTSCGADPEPIVPAVKNYAKVMLFHAATDATAVNLQIDGVTKGDSIKYSFATAYTQAEITGNKIVVSSLSAKTGAKIATDSSLMNKDIGYSYFVCQENNATKTPIMIKKVDDLSLPTAGNGRVRLAHLISDIPQNIDLEFAKVGGVASQNSTFKDVKFKDILDFVNLPIGTYEIKFKLTGTTTLPITIPGTFTVADGKLYTLVARGYANVTAPRGGMMTVLNNN